ncbi:MAG: hypothetical protein HY924_14250 [Elusimicrobia bacterium]|nr:hypothetical protein [Elusimicrobiota bacterium]
MTRPALSLPVLLAAAFLQVSVALSAPPQAPGPVERIFLSQLRGLEAQAGDCEDLRKCAGLMSPAQKELARTELLTLEGRTREGAVLSQISQGFLALGFPQDAARMLKMGPFDTGRASLLSQAAGEFHRQGRYDLAMAAAKDALSFDPKDEAALAVLQLSERRVQKRELSSLPVREQSEVGAEQGIGQPGAVALAKGPPRRPAWPSLSMEVYHMPDTKPPSGWETFITGIGSLAKVYFHSPSSEEKKDIESLKRKLDALPAGKALIADMGGWARVEKEVYFLVTSMPGGTAAYVRPMTPWEAVKTGKHQVLAINKDLMKSGPETVVPVFGHELSHVADKLKGRTEFDLAVTSEHAAHLRQVYLFQEQEKALTPARRKELEKERMWMYQRWVASMWEDHLLKLYPKKEDYQKVFGANKNLQYLAGLAYEDIAKKAVEDGTPQVLYHVSDLYANATHEPEVTEDELLKKIKAETGDSKRSALESLLKKLREARKGFLAADQDYRARTGQTLP